MTVITTLPPASPPTTASRLSAIFSSCGLVRFVDEKHFDVCTALAGSGPAFVAVMVDALADGAVLMGLPRQEAVEMAAQSECDGWREELLADGVVFPCSACGNSKDDPRHQHTPSTPQRRCNQYVPHPVQRNPD